MNAVKSVPCAYMMAISLTCKLDVPYKMHFYTICGVVYILRHKRIDVQNKHRIILKVQSFALATNYVDCTERVAYSMPYCCQYAELYIEVDRNCKFIRFVWVRDDLVVAGSVRLVIIPIYTDMVMNEPIGRAAQQRMQIVMLKALRTSCMMLKHIVMMRHGAMREFKASFTPY